MKKMQGYVGTLLLGIVITTLFFYLSDWYANQIIIQNKSGQDIQNLLIEISSTRIYLENIKNGQRMKFDFLIDSDSNYKIHGQLKDGKLIEYKFGYVTSGFFHCRAFIIIKINGKVEGDSNL